MARKSSPQVQYKALEAAMGRLDPALQVAWVRNFLDHFDSKSVLMGGIVEALDLYHENTFGATPPAAIIERPPETADWKVGESLLSDNGLIDLGYGFNPQVVTVEEAVLAVETQGFTVKSLRSN